MDRTNVLNMFNAYQNGVKRVGVTAEVTLPEFEFKSESIEAAGLMGTVDAVAVGHTDAIEQEIPFINADDDFFNSLMSGQNISMTLRGSQQVTDSSTGIKAEIIIINAVECEPYLTSDHSLMMEKGEQILVGVTLLMKAVNVNKAVIGIENNKPDAIAHLTKLAAAYPGIEIMPLKVQYPQGGEKQLIDAVIRRQVKSGALPISAGAVVQNVGTAYAVYEAVQKNKPLFERVVTVTGKAVANPSNFLVRMGTPINTLIEAAGGIPENTGKIIGGGPMMGKALVSAEVPVTKGSSGVLLLTKEESVRKPMQDCIRCAKCVNVCPMGLNPAFLMKFTIYKDWEKAEANYIQDCIECGSCSYTCPANRPLLDQIRLGKGKVMGIIRARKS